MEKGFTIMIQNSAYLNFITSAGVVIISFGALVGKINFLQITIFAIFETFFFSLNLYIWLFEIVENYDAYNSDPGYGITVHLFGAYFGVSASYIYSLHSFKENCNNFENSFNAYSFVGTLVIWVCFPLFNGLSEFNSRLVTFLSLLGSTFATILVSGVFYKGKINFDYVFRASLAGGVGIASNAINVKNPFEAVLIGIVSGFISIVGYEKRSKTLETRIYLNDSAGIHYLHGLPALFGAFVSIFINGVRLNSLYSILCTLFIAGLSGCICGNVLKQFKVKDDEKTILDIKNPD